MQILGKQKHAWPTNPETRGIGSASGYGLIVRHLDSIKIHSVCVCVVVEDCTGKERCIILHLTLPPKLAPTILAINCSIVARTRFFHKCTDRTLLLSSERGSILIRNLVYKPCRENLCVVQALLYICISSWFLLPSSIFVPPNKMRLSFYYLQGPCHTIHKSRGKCAEFFVLIFLPPREVIYILPRNDLPS